METLILRKTRSMLDVLRVSILYMTQNGRTLFPALGLIALPLILAGNLIAFLATDDRKSIHKLITYWDQLPENAMVALVVAVVIYYLGIFIFNLAVNKHVLCNTNSETSTHFSFESLKQELPEDAKNNIIPFIVIFSIYLIVQYLHNYFFIEDRSAPYAYADNPTAVLSYILEIILGFLPYLLIMSLTFFFCICSLFVCYRDKSDVSDAMKKVMRYIMNKPWKAWLGSILLVFITLTCNTVLQTSFYMLEAWLWSFLDFSPKLFFVSGLLQTIVTFFVALYFLIAILFLFGSIEDEIEGYYLKNKIDNF